MSEDEVGVEGRPERIAIPTGGGDFRSGLFHLGIIDDAQQGGGFGDLFEDPVDEGAEEDEGVDMLAVEAVSGGPILSNCMIAHNRANNGGGMGNSSGSIWVESCPLLLLLISLYRRYDIGRIQGCPDGV